jgi:hypothetical protein
MLSVEFRKHLIDLVEWMLKPENLKVKRVFGQDLTSRDFYGYLKAYSNGFKSPDLPEVQSIFEITVTQVLKTFVEESLNAYKQHMMAFDNPTVENFPAIIEAEHQSGRRKAVDAFMAKKKLGDATHEATFRRQLEEDIQRTFEEWKEERIKTYQQFMEIEKRRREDKEQFERETQAMNQALDVVVAENNRTIEKMNRDKEAMDQQMQQLTNDRIASERRLKEEQESMRSTYDKQIDDFNRQNEEKEAEFQQTMEQIRERNAGDVQALNKAIEEQRAQRAIEVARQAEESKKMQEKFKAELDNKDAERKRAMKEFNDKMTKMEQDRRDEAEKAAKLREQKEKELDATRKTLAGQVETLTKEIQNINKKREEEIQRMKSELKKQLRLEFLRAKIF